MMGFLTRFAHDEHGGTSVEYGMIAVLVSIAGIAGLTLIGPSILEMLNGALAAF